MIEFRSRSSLLIVVVLVALASGLGWVSRRGEHAPRPEGHALVLARGGTRTASDLSEAFVSIAGSVTPAVVRIQAEHQASTQEARRIPGHEFLDPRGSVPEIAGGTGFIVSTDGYILTNNHVVDGAERITVTLVDKRHFAARVVGRDPTTDVAVIKIDARDLPTAALGDSDQARVGEWVLAIGNPGFGDGDDGGTLDFTVTSGIISAKGRPLNILASEMGRNPASNLAIEDFIQTDAVINPGNSGGPLVNLAGNVIGINSAIASSTGYNEGYGFAIPANLARKVMKDLVAYGHVRRPVLGVTISEVGEEDAQAFKLPAISGVLVEDFSGADSPARQAGMERGDVIVSLDGRAVDHVGELQRVVAQHQPGEVVEVGVVRYGERRSTRVKLVEAEMPSLAEAAPPPPAPAGLGVEIADVSPQLARRWSDTGRSAAGGAFVTRVTPFSAADRKLEPGDRIVQINRMPIASAEQAQKLVKTAHSGDVVSIFVQRPRDGRTHIANVRIP